METTVLTETKIEVQVDADANTVRLQPSRAVFGCTGSGRPQGTGTAVRVTRVRWKFQGVPRDLRPVLVFESFIPEPERDDASLSALAWGWDRLRGPCARIEAEGSDQLVGREIAGPRGFYMYRIGLIPRSPDPAHSIQLLDCTYGPAAALEPPPEPVGRTG